MAAGQQGGQSALRSPDVNVRRQLLDLGETDIGAIADAQRERLEGAAGLARRPMISAGGGMKFRLSQHLVFRADFRDYISPIPRQVITPGPGTRMKGLLHDFIGMGGISYVF